MGNLEGKWHYQCILDEAQPPKVLVAMCKVGELQVLIMYLTDLTNEDSDFDIPYAVPKYRTDGDTCRYRSAHPSKCLQV